MKRKIIIAVFGIFCILNSFSQEAPFFTNKQLQYAYMNPGYIPELRYATINVGGRFQWTGIEGMPIDGFFSGKYFFVGAHSQIGINILYDKIGYQQIINPMLDYAFCVPIGDDSYLNMGVSAGLMNKAFDKDKIKYNNIDDENVIDENLEKGNAPDINAGFEILLQNFEFGASAMHLLNKTKDISMNKTFLGYANYNFQSTEWWRLSPAYALYYFNGDKNSDDIWKHQISLYFYYINDYDSRPTDLFYVGTAYRIPYEAAFTLGFSLGFCSIFYSYDYFFGNIRHSSYGSHEIGVEFKILQHDKGCYANYGRSRKKYTRYYRMR